MNEKMRDIKISVIVPVYNVEEYINRCMDSLINQTYKNIEIILVDDGSTDNSGNICDEYAKEDSRIKVIHKTNGGIVSARKEAVIHATGEYVTCVDSDDWVESDAYEDVVKKLVEYEPDMVAFGYKKEFDNCVEQFQVNMEAGYYSEDEFWTKFNKCVEDAPFLTHPVDMLLWNKIIRLDIFKKYQLKCDENLKKDNDDAVIFPCLLDIKDIYISSQCWYHYCVRKSSISWKKSVASTEHFYNISKYLLQSIKDCSYEIKVDKKFILYKLLHCLILANQELLFNNEFCLLFPQIKRGCKVIIYGKGALANKLIAYMQDKEYCNVVANIDSGDVERLFELAENEYDYIVIAVLNSGIVANIRKVLEEYNVPREKVLFIDKNNMTKEMLPDEIKKLYEEVV